MLDASSRISKTSWIRFILFMIMYKWICYLHTSSFKFIWDFVILSTSEQKQLHRKWRIDWVFLIILFQHLHRKPYLNFLFNCSVLIYSIWNPSKRCHFNVLAYFAYYVGILIFCFSNIFEHYSIDLRSISRESVSCPMEFRRQRGIAVLTILSNIQPSRLELV